MNIVKLNRVTVSYPHLWKKQAPKGYGEDQAKYSIECIMDANSPDLQTLEAAFQEIAQAAGKKPTEIEYLRRPWRTGEQVNQNRLAIGLPPREEVVGKIVLSAGDKQYAPQVVAQDGRTPITEEQSGNLFGGCICNVLVRLYWSGNPKNPGVFVGLQAVQLVDNVNVTKLGGTTVDASDYFEPVEGAPAPSSPAVSQPGPKPDWA